MPAVQMELAEERRILGGEAGASQRTESGQKPGAHRIDERPSVWHLRWYGRNYLPAFNFAMNISRTASRWFSMSW